MYALVHAVCAQALQGSVQCWVKWPHSGSKVLCYLQCNINHPEHSSAGTAATGLEDNITLIEHVFKAAC